MPNNATASQKRIKSCETVNNEDTADSNTDNRSHTAIRFSSPLVTEHTETGEKRENRSNITDNNPPTQTNKIIKALEVPVGGKISHEDERDSDDDSSEEEDGYYDLLQDNDITMIPKINDALSSGRKEVQVGGAMLTNIINEKWKEVTLTLKVQWDNKDTTWETLQDLKEDHPRLVTSYLIAHGCSRRKKGSRDVNLS